MDILATAAGMGHSLLAVAAEAGAEGGGGGGLTINVFWIVVSAANFVLFFALAYLIVLKPVGRTIASRRDRIEQGLKDADAARRDREAAADQRQAILAEARREANDIVSRAQRLADETREQELVSLQSDLERRRRQAETEIEAERVRTLNAARAQVADLALLAAGKVVGETMSDQRERRLVDEFLSQVTAPAPGAAQAN